MTDHYEMPHPDADACSHAGVGKACRPCREVLDNLERIDLRHTPGGRELMAEAWEAGVTQLAQHGDVDANPYRETDA